MENKKNFMGKKIPPLIPDNKDKFSQGDRSIMDENEVSDTINPPPKIPDKQEKKDGNNG